MYIYIWIEKSIYFHGHEIEVFVYQRYLQMTLNTRDVLYFNKNSISLSYLKRIYIVSILKIEIYSSALKCVYIISFKTCIFF